MPARTKGVPAPRLARYLGIAFTALILVLYLIGVPLLDLLELKTYDMRLLSRPAGAADAKVTIVAIDEKSLAGLGRWPWSRRTLAQLVERLDRLGVRAIALDAFFSEPERDENEASAHLGAADKEFARALANSGKAVLSTVFLLRDDEARHVSAGTATRTLKSIENQAIGAIRMSGQPAEFPMVRPKGVLANLPMLQAAARYAGHINTLPDPDGTLRWAPLVMRYQDRYFPSGDVQAVRAWLGAPDLILHIAPYGIAGLSLGNRFVPSDEYGRILIRYRGPENTFPTVSALDVLQGNADVALLRDRIALVGATAKGIGDIRVTPYSPVFPGVEIRATVMQNLLDGDFLRRPEWMAGVDAVVILVLGLALTFALPRLGVRNGLLLAAGAVALYLAIAQYLFHTEQLWLNVVYPSTLAVLLFMSSTLVQYFSTESERKRVKLAFQHYVPAKVVDEIMQDIDKLRLGGDKRELTVLFSDIRGFTSVAESLPPEDLVRLLNTYLTRMTELVFLHDGLLDKYIGDAIMAVYGAPIPRADHALAACHTALDMMRELGELQAQWHASGQPVLDIGIGINSGPMVVGNMGSETRFDYTVIGDAVNLGSRIESLNKVYGTHILLSEATWRQVRDAFPQQLREIDVAHVRGRTELVRIFELIPKGRYRDLDWLPEFAHAYEQLRAGNDEQAIAVFERLHRELGDPVSALHLARARSPQRRTQDQLQGTA
jgi:adenylate cyclase